MTDREYGRPTKFFWYESDSKRGDDFFDVFVGDQDTSIKCIRTSYKEIKDFVDFMEQEKKGRGRYNMKKELTLCKWCNCMTKTITKKGLSGSENTHYIYKCGKCGYAKDLVDISSFEDAVKKVKGLI
jgi:hypothetical protein